MEKKSYFHLNVKNYDDDVTFSEYYTDKHRDNK